MHPEVVDSHDEADLQAWLHAENGALTYHRNRYIQATRNNSSVIRGLFNDLVHFRLPGGELNQARREYTAVRDAQIRTLARVEVDQDPANLADDVTYRQTLASQVSAMTISEMRIVSQETAVVNANHPHGYVPGFLRSGRNRMLIGWGLNLAIGLTAASGLVPVSVGLVGARVALGTIGTESVLRGVGNFIADRTDRFDDRHLAGTNPHDTTDHRLSQLEDSLAAWNNHRMRRNVPAATAIPQENALYAEYQTVLTQHIEQRLIHDGINSHGGVNPPAPNVAAPLVDSLRAAMQPRTERQLDRIEHQQTTTRNWTGIRWVAAFGLSIAATGMTSPATTVANFQGTDAWHLQHFGNGDVSSLHGMAQNDIAKFEMGIDLDGHLQAGDPVLKSFWDRWEADANHYEAAASAYENWIRMNNPHAFFGDYQTSDLLLHDYDISVPLRPDSFFQHLINWPDWALNWHLPWSDSLPIYRNPLPYFGGDNWGVDFGDRFFWQWWFDKRWRLIAPWY